MRTFVINLASQAVTEFVNYSFDSITKHGDAYYATGTDPDGVEGIFRLGGADDNGTPIEAAFLTGANGFNTAKQVRLEQANLTVRKGPGEVNFVTVANEEDKRTFVVPIYDTPGDQNRRIPLPRRVNAHSWQIGVENINGADFEINQIAVAVQATTRTQK